MAHLAITLFGGFRVELDCKALTDLGTDKNRALLAYLAVESESSHRREELASLFWPDHCEVDARNSLRQALFQLRRVLETESQKESILHIQSNQVQFNQASDCWVDVVEFKTRLAKCLFPHPLSLSLDDSCLESLQRATQLYRGEFLAGLTLPHCIQFSDWQIIHQEFLHRQMLMALSFLADDAEDNLEYDQLIAWTQKRIELEPWSELAYRRQMWALSMSGEREKALHLYKTLQEILEREMGISPTDGTRCLYEQIRDGNLLGPRIEQITRTVSSSPHSPIPVGPSFVGRQSELAQLDGFLNDSLAGQGRVVFVSGEAGSGKTALMNEFASRAMRSHRDLLVASGACSSYLGLGDTFQPFREILEAMAGITPLPYGWDRLSSESTKRLSHARPVLLKTLLEESPGLTVSLLSAQNLLQRVRETPGLDSTIVTRLETLIAHLTAAQTAHTSAETGIPSQSSMESFLLPTNFYEQAARLLRSISRHFPLLILFDNLQWLDCTSASLLFHLGGHISEGRILLLGAYRPEDVTSVQGSTRHPLAAILNEFQRLFGEIQVDLSSSDGRSFVNSYLDSQLYHINPEFRETLYQHTHGNALYTEELLHAMQARGDMVQDSNGHWTQGSHIDWEPLPARLAAVISEQLSRLNENCLTLLKAASLQGEVFTTDALAQALGGNKDQIISTLSGPLSKQHLLVSPFSPVEDGNTPPLYYRFRNLLLQKYLCQSLDVEERTQLKGPLPHGV